MEADWEIEIASDAPVIDADWSGFVDLHTQPDSVTRLQEVQQFPALGDILLRLNGLAPDRSQQTTSPFWTAKCDLWVPESIDPDEMEASMVESSVARACYVDLIPVDSTRLASLAELESKARQIVSSLRAIPLRCSRIDLILRQAIAGGRHGFGITVYTTACGSADADAEQTLTAALGALVQAISSGQTS